MADQNSVLKEYFTKEYMQKTVFFKVNQYSVFTMILMVALNIGGNYLAKGLHLPLWLDCLGTTVTSVLFGPLAGVIVSIVSLTILYFIESFKLLYVLPAISTAVIVGFLFPRKNLNDNFTVVSVAFLTGLVSTIICVPLNILYYRGYPGNLWGDALYDMLKINFNAPRLDILAAEAFIDLPDRLLCVYIGLFLYKLNQNLLKRRGSKKKKQIKAAAGILIILIPFLLLPQTGHVEAKGNDLASEYETLTYGSHEGIPVSEINAVAQTENGYIWVGTYSGLYRFDGITFEEGKIDERIRNVMVLFPDSKGRLWIGTNDSGVACYDYKTGDVTFYSTENGLPADSIRAIGEDPKGNIYIGTVMQLVRLSPEGSLKTYSEWEDVSYVISFDTLSNGNVVGVTNGGVLFMISDDTLLYTNTFPRDGASYRVVESAGDFLLVGTTGNVVDRYRIEDSSLRMSDHITIQGENSFNKLCYVESMNGFFYCCESGLGFMDFSNGRSLSLAKKSFDGSVSDVCYDNQGNIWFGSTKHGLLKYSRAPFINHFNKAGIDGGVVNALLSDGDLLYIGMDKGLKIINLSTEKEVTKPYQELFNGVRIRHILKDSKGNLWFSTYGENGLICINKDGKERIYTDKTEGTLGNKFRSVIELSNGDLLAASNLGLSFIRNGKVIATIGEKNGLTNQYILSMIERPDGSVLAGSDGGGIFIIKDQRIVGHIDREEGLNASVVLRIAPCGNGYVYVTSNALYYDDGTNIRELKNFPYSNNYDVIFSGNNKAWITSSAGLYLLSEEDLINDGEYTPTLFNEKWGLTTKPNSNSWNILIDDQLFLCCKDGVRSVAINKYSTIGVNYPIHLKSVDVSGEPIPETNGKYVIPATTGRIRFNIAINNYTLSDPLVHYYLEGTEDEGITCFQSEVVPLEFTNLPHGDYTLHVQILDEITGKVKKESTFEIIKTAHMYEKLYFQIYSIFVLGLLFAYFIWLLYTVLQKAMSASILQKEISTDAMTGLLNKGAIHKQMPAICQNETGILIMIDLDSFKLVNDLYGHDMGDRILIRFAQLIKEAVKDGDITGRLGGDEFMAFIKNTVDEEDVDYICQYLNKGIVKSAKEFMGEDMNIPLGASLGAVRVPMEGRDFDELFRHADKALYLVKQNGKHGYALYQKSNEDQENAEDKKSHKDLAEIKQIIGERNEGKGAYSVNFERLQVIYRYLSRNNRVTMTESGFARITPETADGSKITDQQKEGLEDALLVNLRRNDVVSFYSGCFYVLSECESMEVFEKRLNEIINKWKTDSGNNELELKLEIEAVG